MAEHSGIEQDREDGSWFLEAVGLKKRAPSPKQSIVELHHENTQIDEPPEKPEPPSQEPDADDTPAAPVVETSEAPEGIIIEMTSFDGDPGTSLSTFDPVPELPPLPSNVAVAIPPKQSSQPDILSVSVDESTLAAPLKTRRPFRWPAFGLGLAVIAAIVLGVLWLPTAVDNAAASTRTAYYDASLSVREYLPTAQASLDIVTRASSTDAALGTVIPVVSELTSHATNLATTASEPLPKGIPLLSSDAIDELPPLQDRSAILASDSSEVARQIGHAYVYRTSIDDLLVVGDLPTAAGSEEINALSVTLAASLAENASLVADLPSNPAFDDVASSAAEALGAYAQWQKDYLSALADENAFAAIDLINDITAVRDTLVAQTAKTLLSFRETLDERIVLLSREFDEHMANLSQ